MWYTVSCSFMDEGLTTRGAFVSFRSRAKTRRGLLRTMAKAVVSKVGTDCYDVGRKVLVARRKHDNGEVMLLTTAERVDLWKMGHDMLLGR